MPVVCEECNHTWMSDLTNQTKQTFERMIIDGTPTCLLPAGIDLLSAFTFLKAVVVDHGTEPEEPFFTRAARERFKAGLVIPPAVQIWIGAFQGAAAYSGRVENGFLIVNEPGPLYGMQFYTFTYVVGKLVLQLLAPRWKQLMERYKPLPRMTPHSYWDQATVQLWPNAAAGIAWPPSKYLGDKMIQPFIDRFNVQTNLRL